MGQTILLAEDNDSVAAPLEQLLRKNGYGVVRARDGVEALSRIVAAPPDILLLDLKMPRLHGVELLKKIRQSDRTRSLPVIVMTGIYRGEKNAGAARQLGVAAYLEKPFRASDLLEAIRSGLGNAPEQAPADGATFDRHLQAAFLDRFSGTMTFAVNDRRQTLSFVNGTPISLRQGITHDDFGAFLHGKGIISSAEYDYYRDPGDFRHDVLVQLGCLEYPELMQQKLSYLGSELVSAFGLPPFSVEMNRVNLPADMQIISINLPRIFYGGYHMHPGPGGRALLERNGERYPHLKAAYYDHINFLGLKTDEQEFLQGVDGQRTLVDCLANREALLPLLQTLAGFDMIGFSEAPGQNAVSDRPIRCLFNQVEEEESALGAPESLESFTDLVDDNDMPDVELAAPEQTGTSDASYDLAVGKKVRQTLAEMQGKNHYEIFGLRQGDFSFDALKQKYFALTHEFGPELMMQLSGEEAGLVEEILSLVSTAYNTLSDVVRKERYDELLGSDTVGLGQKGDDKFQAQVQSQSGKVFIEMGEWDNAIKALQDAVNIDPQSGDYLAHLGWAIYRNPANARSQAMRDKGKQMINRALTLDRTAEGFAFKGWIIFESGQDNLAEAEFNKALKLDARNALARSGLREIREKREQDKKGLFRKMFR